MRPVRWMVCWAVKECCCQYSVPGRAERLCGGCPRPLKHLSGAWEGCRPQGEESTSGVCGRAGSSHRGTVTELEFLLSVQMGNWILLFFYNAGAEGQDTFHTVGQQS